MATSDEPLIEIIDDDSVRYSSRPPTNSQKELSSNSESTFKKPSKKRGCLANLKSKFRRQVCLTSKPAILVLIWSFLTSMLHCVFIDPSSLIIPLTLARYVHYSYHFLTMFFNFAML